MLYSAIRSDSLRPVLLESFGCDLDRQPKQIFGRFLQNGSTGSVRLISMDNLPLSRKTSFGSVELSRSNRRSQRNRGAKGEAVGSVNVKCRLFERNITT